MVSHQGATTLPWGCFRHLQRPLQCCTAAPEGFCRALCLACHNPRISRQAVVIAGMGFFADAYDLFSISLLTRLLGRIYYQARRPCRAAVGGLANHRI